MLLYELCLTTLPSDSFIQLGFACSSYATHEGCGAGARTVQSPTPGTSQRTAESAHCVCRRYTDQGVGDTADSWAVDGRRKLLWHASASDGPSREWSRLRHRWHAGDVIGLACNVASGQIAVGLNGCWESDRAAHGALPHRAPPTRRTHC